MATDLFRRFCGYILHMGATGEACEFTAIKREYSHMRYNHCERDAWELTFSHTFIIVDNCEMRRFSFNAFLQTRMWALSWKPLLSFSWILPEKFRKRSFVAIFTGFFLPSCYAMTTMRVLRILYDCSEHRSTVSEWKGQSCLRLRLRFCTRVDPWDPGLIWFSAAFLATE